MSIWGSMATISSGAVVRYFSDDELGMEEVCLWSVYVGMEKEEGEEGRVVDEEKKIYYGSI